MVRRLRFLVRRVRLVRHWVQSMSLVGRAGLLGPAGVPRTPVNAVVLMALLLPVHEMVVASAPLVAVAMATAVVHLASLHAMLLVPLVIRMSAHLHALVVLNGSRLKAIALLVVPAAAFGTYYACSCKENALDPCDIAGVIVHGYAGDNNDVGTSDCSLMSKHKNLVESLMRGVDIIGLDSIIKGAGNPM